jgi:hypothetical protein
MVLSYPYPKPGIARTAAKKQERCRVVGKFIILYDPVKKWFLFADGDTSPDSNLSVIERHELINGKWRDKTPLGKVTCSGGYVVKS